VQLAGTDVHRKSELFRVWLGGPFRQLGAGRFSTHKPNGGSSGSSASEMNSAGKTMPRCGCCQRTRPQPPSDGPVPNHLWLVVKDELLQPHRLAQLDLHGRTVAHHGLHLGIEETQRVAAGVLDWYMARSACLQQFFDGGRVAVKQGDADARVVWFS